MIVLKNCRLVTQLTEGFDGSKADVVVDGDRITDILPAGTRDEWADAQVIDVAGKTLLPGLIDLHTHLYFTNENIDWLSAKSSVNTVIDCASYALDKLKYGYTTLRDCGGAFGAHIAVRNGINRGVLEGPRVIASGHCVTPTTKGNDAFGELYLEFDDPAQARGVVRRELADGADFIKYMATGAVLNLGGEPGAMISTETELSALVEAAEENGTYVAAHCHGTRGIIACAKTGVRTIEHASYLDETALEAILDAGNKSAIVPTLAIVYAILDPAITPGLPAEIIEKTTAARDAMLKGAKLAYDNGVQVGWGTDIDQESFDKAPFLEFTARADMGLAPIQILRQATIDSARIIGIDDAVGTLKKGKVADLIVMDGNPDEDINVMQQAPALVFAHGKRFQSR